MKQSEVLQQVLQDHERVLVSQKLVSLTLLKGAYAEFTQFSFERGDFQQFRCDVSSRQDLVGLTLMSVSLEKQILTWHFSGEKNFSFDFSGPAL